MHNDPIKISSIEWKEIFDIEAVKQSWGLADEGTPEDLASMVYGVKFNFMSGCPGYVGDLFIIQGDILTGDAPVILIRDRAGKLKFCYE